MKTELILYAPFYLTVVKQLDYENSEEPTL